MVEIASGIACANTAGASDDDETGTYGAAGASEDEVTA